MAKRAVAIINTQACRYCGTKQAELVECSSCEGHQYGPDDNGLYGTPEALEYACDVCDMHGKRYVCKGCGAHFCTITSYKHS